MVRECPDLKAYHGRELTVIAWLWARTVKSPNPAFADVDVPLASTFMLSTKKGKEAYVEPVIEGREYRFVVKVGAPPDADAAKAGTKLSRGANFRCLMSRSPISGDHIKAEGQAKRIGARLMAIVAKGDHGRVYLAPISTHEKIARTALPKWRPDLTISGSTQYLGVKPYGMNQFDQLFTSRQLLALDTFSALATEVRERVQRDAAVAGLPDDGRPLRDGGTGATAYAEAIAMYLAFALSKLTDRGSTICTWYTDRDSTRHTFSRQSIPMTWDYAELNTLLTGTGSFRGAVEWTAESIDGVAAGYGSSVGVGTQADARKQTLSSNRVVSTDPPYYDNIPYADLSDFFYVWLRRSLTPVFPDLFATLAVPKADELVAFPYRHGSRDAAETFFLQGMTLAMRCVSEQAHPGFPVTIYYAFKQSEIKGTPD